MKKNENMRTVEKICVFLGLLILAALLVFAFAMMLRSETKRLKTAEKTAADAVPDRSKYELDTPVIHRLEADAKGNIVVEWDEIEGAVYYKVVRRVEGGSWKKLKITKKTSFKDKTAEDYQKYYYAVRVVAEDKKTNLSTYQPKGDIMPRPTPVLKEAVREDTGICFTWEKVDQCERYEIDRKTENEDWVKIGESTEPTFTDTNAEPGKVYYYTCRCLTKSGKTIVSGYDKAGVKVSEEK